MRSLFSILLLLLAAAPIVVNAADDERHVNYLLKTNALNYQDNLEIDMEVHGNCISGTPESNQKADVQTTRHDEQCKALGPCHIGFTQAGEWVAYNFYHSDKDIAYTDYEGFHVILVNITVRVSAPGPRNINLEIADDGNELGPVSTKTVYGRGYDIFEDVTWENVELQPMTESLLRASTFGRWAWDGRSFKTLRFAWWRWIRPRRYIPSLFDSGRDL